MLLVKIKNIFKFYDLCLAIVFFLLSYYWNSFAFSFLGENHRFSLLVISFTTITFNLLRNIEFTKKILKSRYLIILIYLILNVLFINSTTALRELIIGFALLSIIYLPSKNLKNIVKYIFLINFLLIIISSLVYLSVNIGFVDINNWDVRNLSWIKENSPLSHRALRFANSSGDRCFYNPYFITIIDYIAINCSPDNFTSAFRVSFFWLEPAQVLISCSYICLASQLKIIKNTRYIFLILFLINSFSLTLTSLLSFINILSVKLYSFLNSNKFQFKKFIFIFFLITLSIILFFFINNFASSKIDSMSLIFPIDSLLDQISFLGAKQPYNDEFKFGIYKIFNRYGIVGFLCFIYCYLTIFLKSIKEIYISNSSTKTILYSSLILAFFALLRSPTIFSPTIILLDEYIKKINFHKS